MGLIEIIAIMLLFSCKYAGHHQIKIRFVFALCLFYFKERRIENI
jgi:hypothetical protein